MDNLTCYKIRNKYNNQIFPRLSYILIEFLNNNNQNYLDLVLSNLININDIIYFLRYKDINNEDDLLYYTIRYIELKHGILTKTKQ